MNGKDPELTISTLGDCHIASPMSGVQFVSDEDHVLLDTDLREIEKYLKAGRQPPRMELGGPREKIFFDPVSLNCGIVTCGGLCPGLNDVIRAIVLGLFHHYGVKTVYGFRYGYEGLTDRHEAVRLNPDVVSNIHRAGGTILGSSRGPQVIGEMVDTLERLGVGILFTVGGDGTLKGAGDIAGEVARRGLDISVIGVPKTIDNDISFVQMSFGFVTAVSEARTAIYSAHVEAVGAKNGVGLVKLMGRESGFIAAYASLANSDVNFCLIPEVPFGLKAFLDALEERLQVRGHTVVVVGEGAGQNLLGEAGGLDASGNVVFGDIGIFLRDRIKRRFKERGVPVNLKYIDPSYTIRSMPAESYDSAFCLLLGQNAVHAGMAGKTDMIVGYWNNRITHVPIPLAVSRRRKIMPDSWVWSSVLSATGQPRSL